MKKKQRHEINKLTQNYNNLFKATESYLTKGKRSNLAKLYTLAGMRGDKSKRSQYVRGFHSDEAILNGLASKHDARSIFSEYLNALKAKRRDMIGDPAESKFAMAMRGCVVSFGERMFAPKNDVRWIANRITEWRPNLIGDLTAQVVKHSSQKTMCLPTTTLRMTPGEARLRRDKYNNPAESDDHVPLVATDRFIMWFASGVPEKICDGDDVMVAFITDDSRPKVTWGWLSKFGTEFGCSANLSDARKAAKMRAVRKAKKALGLV